MSAFRNSNARPLTVWLSELPSSELVMNSTKTYSLHPPRTLHSLPSPRHPHHPPALNRITLRSTRSHPHKPQPIHRLSLHHLHRRIFSRPRHLRRSHPRPRKHLLRLRSRLRQIDTIQPRRRLHSCGHRQPRTTDMVPTWPARHDVTELECATAQDRGGGSDADR